MIVLIRKKTAVAALLLCGILSGTTAFLIENRSISVSANTIISEGVPVYVIDAGHGGEDGGAVASDGTIESRINLEIAFRLQHLLCFLGEETIMIRSEDQSIYSDGAETLREKKVSDLKNRVALVNNTPNAVLISIHQNSLPSSITVHGAQVFFNTLGNSQLLAENTQSILNQVINGSTPKKHRKISGEIYLMKNVIAPAILVECGFLSNPQETDALKNSSHQKKIAAAIASGILTKEMENTNEDENPVLLHGMRE